MPTQILISPELQAVLDAQNVTQYGPAYGGESVGLDLYYVGKERLEWSGPPLSGPGHAIHAYLDTNPTMQVRLIETGLKIKLSPNMVGLILERGSVSKTNLVKRAGVIDPGYTGTVFVNLASLGGSYVIHPGDKLPVQLVVVPCDNQFVPVTPSEWATIISTSKRKEGKVGSSN